MKEIMLKCDYCSDEIEALEKICLRLITPEGKLIDKCYHLCCFFKLLEDNSYLAQLQAEFLVEITQKNR